MIHGHCGLPAAAGTGKRGDATWARGFTELAWAGLDSLAHIFFGLGFETYRSDRDACSAQRAPTCWAVPGRGTEIAQSSPSPKSKSAVPAVFTWQPVPQVKIAAPAVFAWHLLAFCIITSTSGASTIDLRWLECGSCADSEDKCAAIDRLHCKKKLQNLHPNPCVPEEKYPIVRMAGEPSVSGFDRDRCSPALHSSALTKQ